MATLHKDLTVAKGIHIPHSFEYANTAARLAATGFTSADLHKIALQLDNHTLWILTATTPSWQSVGSNTESLVKVSAADTTAGYLQDKFGLGVGEGLTLTLNNPGADESLSLTLDTFASFDPKTVLSASDVLLIEDSADGGAKKQITLSAIGELFMSAVTGTYTYTNAGGEQTVIEITGATKKLMSGLSMDFSELTQNGTLKIYSKVDDTNYRLVSTHDFTVATDSDGILFNYSLPVNIDLKITYTESTDEGADRDIPFSYILEG